MPAIAVVTGVVFVLLVGAALSIGGASKDSALLRGIDEAQTMRCGNCAAFIQTPEMLECIVSGIDPEEGEEGYAPEVEEAADLGYCELFDFKCAGDRTCSAWLAGGPITQKMTNRQKQMLMMAKTEYDTEDEEMEDED